VFSLGRPVRYDVWLVPWMRGQKESKGMRGEVLRRAN